MDSTPDSFREKKAEHWLSKLPRLFDLYRSSKKEDPRNYFNVEFPLPLFEDEKRFARLDVKSWEVLRDKAVPYVVIDDPLRCYQQLWNTLDEARGYVFLADQGYDQVEFIEPSREGGIQSPDLIGCKVGSTAILEVKTINESNDCLNQNAAWRHGATIVRPDLSEEFKSKLVSTIEQARNQLNSYPRPPDRRIVLLVVHLDYGQKTGGHLYIELEGFIASQPQKDGIEIYHQVAL